MMYAFKLIERGFIEGCKVAIIQQLTTAIERIAGPPDFKKHQYKANEKFYAILQGRRNDSENYAWYFGKGIILDNGERTIEEVFVRKLDDEYGPLIVIDDGGLLRSDLTEIDLVSISELLGL